MRLMNRNSSLDHLRTFLSKLTQQSHNWPPTAKWKRTPPNGMDDQNAHTRHQTNALTCQGTCSIYALLPPAAASTTPCQLGYCGSSGPSWRERAKHSQERSNVIQTEMPNATAAAEPTRNQGCMMGEEEVIRRQPGGVIESCRQSHKPETRG